jgi:hypothetical protein
MSQPFDSPDFCTIIRQVIVILIMEVENRRVVGAQSRLSRESFMKAFLYMSLTTDAGVETDWPARWPALS